MDYISKALEKAKIINRNGEIGHPAKDKVLFSDYSSYPAAPIMPLGEINYTITRTLPVDKEYLHQQRVIYTNSSDSIGEAYKLLRTKIFQLTRPKKQNLLMVTGPLTGEGKTLTAINLAISLSQELDKTVLLVDADLRRPTIHEYFGLPQMVGLVDYLRGTHTIPELLVHPEGFSRLVLLPGGSPVDDAAELISSPIMANLAEELKHFYPDRYVFFDLPPVLAFADALAFAPLVDSIILVVECGKTSRKDIQQCLELLKNFSILGIILNKVRRKYPDYYYPDYYKKQQKQAQESSWLRWVKNLCIKNFTG